MRRVLFVLLLAVSIYNSNAQSISPEQVDIAVMKAFLTDVSNTERRADIILSQHVLLEKTPSNDSYDYLEASIDEIRLNLYNKDLEALEYVPFNKLPKKETRDIDPEGKPTDKMYFIRYKGRQLFAIYLDQDKIASFTLVSKGNNRAHFVTY